MGWSHHAQQVLLSWLSTFVSTHPGKNSKSKIGPEKPSARSNNLLHEKLWSR